MLNVQILPAQQIRLDQIQSNRIGYLVKKKGQGEPKLPPKLTPFLPLFLPHLLSSFNICVANAKPARSYLT